MNPTHRLVMVRDSDHCLLKPKLLGIQRQAGRLSYIGFSVAPLPHALYLPLA